MRFAALRARTGRFSRSCLAAGLDPGGFPRASTSYVCGAAAIPPCAANCRQPNAVRESRSDHRSGQPVSSKANKVDNPGKTVRQILDYPINSVLVIACPENVPQLWRFRSSESKEIALPVDPPSPSSTAGYWRKAWTRRISRTAGRAGSSPSGS